MLREILRSLKILLILSILTGIAYPFLILGLGQVFFPFQAKGSIFIKDGKVKGSFLIGQTFAKNEYFQGRPSVVDYNAASSGASNLGPTSAKLIDSVKDRVDLFRRNNPSILEKEVPADIVLASASGLDPHISPEAAMLQVGRVADVRKISKTQVMALVNSNIEPPQFGFLGSPRVNVLRLNVALDSLEGVKHE
jgi:potassium-transporting ATPase KdpC subunit